ncbi:PilN domain-containing protein [Polyangium aurulentum]|uniref:PilN domain-containing protein n=1 Tax=Polyangium aurulentum TaxID=2567896 RepID=UPI0010ADFD32|nr:PilN domain-containing protein [Polyangium aurulentum]UQA63322.1 PilN domain-containing protein [Polyangium aurulentum]
MIRINLLPSKRVSSSQPSQRWLLAVLAALLLEIVGLFLFYQAKREQLDEQNRTNAQLKSQIDDINKLVADHEEIKKALAVLRAREEAIAKLQAGRTGPTAVLLELSQILSAGKGPSADPDKLAKLRKDNPLAVYNPSWDARRLWLTSYLEGQRTVRIEGLARDGNDVYELAQRLKLSPYFYEVTLLPGKKDADRATKVDLVSFALQLKVRY